MDAHKTRLKSRFGIEFGEDDPASDYFLGANRQSSRRDVAKVSASSYIDLMVKRYLPDTDLSKFLASWSYTAADESLTSLWEAMSTSRPTASPELTKSYGSLFGALLHATKYRPEVMAALGLLGSCLSYPSQELYDLHLVRVLVYLARTRSLGVTYSKHADNARRLRAFADSNWSVTRSTTGYSHDHAGGRRHRVSLETATLHLDVFMRGRAERVGRVRHRAPPRLRHAHVHRSLAGLRYRVLRLQQGHLRSLPSVHLCTELTPHRP